MQMKSMIKGALFYYSIIQLIIQSWICGLGVILLWVLQTSPRNQEMGSRNKPALGN